MQKNVAKFMFQIKLSTILAPHTGHFTMKVLRNEQAMQYRFGRNAATGAFSNEPELKNLFFFFFYYGPKWQLVQKHVIKYKVCKNTR